MIRGKDQLIITEYVKTIDAGHIWHRDDVIMAGRNLVWRVYDVV